MINSFNDKLMVKCMRKLVRKFHNPVVPIANTCSIGYPHDGRADNAAQGGGGTITFCGYIGEAPASTSKPKKLLRFTDHPKKIPVLSGMPQKILGLLAYPKKLHVFIFFMPIDDILSHPYDLSCWWDVKSKFNQPTEHVTIQLVYVGTRK